MDDFRLTSEQIAALRALHKKQRDRKKADSVKAIVIRHYIHQTYGVQYSPTGVKELLHWLATDDRHC